MILNEIKMSTKTKDADSEALIKETAKKLFFGEGKFNATTQEIADAAGVNRTLINYYFRSRNNLFDLVFKDAQEKQQERTASIIFSEAPFKEKITQFIDDSLKLAIEYPYLEMYLVTQFNQGCYFKDQAVTDRMLEKFYIEFEHEMDKGTILKMEPAQFIINMISMISFPISMRPLIQKSLKIDDLQYTTILKNRKQIILNTLFIN